MTDHPAAAYDARAAEYIAVAGELEQMSPEDRAVIAAWREATPGRLLDAGCGPGHWTAFLQQGGRDVLGIDLSEQFIGHARVRFPEVSFVHGSFTTLPVPDAALGGILAWYSVIHTPPTDLPEVFTEFARAVAPGGSILLGFFDGTPREPFAHAVAPAHFWNAEALADLLDEAGFTVTASATRAREPSEISIRPHGHLIARRR